jgi:hypothetical protein
MMLGRGSLYRRKVVERDKKKDLGRVRGENRRMVLGK